MPQRRYGRFEEDRNLLNTLGLPDPTMAAIKLGSINREPKYLLNK